MQDEEWARIPDFPNYVVSSTGKVMARKTEIVKEAFSNQQDFVFVTLVLDRVSYSVSLAQLVAEAFLPPAPPHFNSVINLNGDRFDCRAENLARRPRWFAVRYNRQIRENEHLEYTRVPFVLIDIDTGEEFDNVREPALRYGLLYSDLLAAALNQQSVIPTGHRFEYIPR